jgi:hypothetical protein
LVFALLKALRRVNSKFWRKPHERLTIESWSFQMLLNRTIFAVAVLWWTAAPALLAQDFLKQLEEKILKRQEDSKSKQTPPKESTSAGTESSENLPAPKPPSPPPMLLGPASKDAPIEDLPVPKGAPELEATPSRSTSKPPAKRSPSFSSNPLPAPTSGGGGYLGMTVESIPGGGFGLVVAEVKPDSPAWKAGFRAGDRLIGVEGNAVSTVDAFAEQLSLYSPGTPVRFLVERLGKSSSVTAVLMDRNLANRIHGNVPGTQSDLRTTERRSDEALPHHFLPRLELAYSKNRFLTHSIR